MAQVKTITRWNEEGESVVLNQPIRPGKGPNLTEEHAVVIAFNEAEEVVQFWAEKGYTLDKDPNMGKPKAEKKPAAKKARAEESVESLEMK